MASREAHGGMKMKMFRPGREGSPLWYTGGRRAAHLPALRGDGAGGRAHLPALREAGAGGKDERNGRGNLRARPSVQEGN